MKIWELFSFLCFIISARFFARWNSQDANSILHQKKQACWFIGRTLLLRSCSSVRIYDCGPFWESLLVNQYSRAVTDMIGFLSANFAWFLDISRWTVGIRCTCFIRKPQQRRKKKRRMDELQKGISNWQSEYPGYGRPTTSRCSVFHQGWKIHTKTLTMVDRYDHVLCNGGGRYGSIPIKTESKVFVSFLKMFNSWYVWDR